MPRDKAHVFLILKEMHCKINEPKQMQPGSRNNASVQKQPNHPPIIVDLRPEAGYPNKLLIALWWFSLYNINPALLGGSKEMERRGQIGKRYHGKGSS